MEEKKEHYLKVTIAETSSSESSRESSSCYKESDSSSDAEDPLNMCMSPPSSSRMIKKSTKRSSSKSKRRRHHSKKKSDKRPLLINSAENVKVDDSSDLLYAKQEVISAPVTSVEETDSLQWPKLTRQTNTVDYSVSTKKTTSTTKKSVFGCRINRSNINIDPFDRGDSIKKITLLLKLALSTRMNKELKLASVPPPPSTPSTSMINNSFSHAFKSNKSSDSNLSSQISFNKQSSALSNHSTSSMSSQNACMQDVDLNRQQERYQQAENVWKEIYDCFEFYNDRATPDNIELIDKRLAEARVLIPVTIKEIMSTNFQQITTKMNNDIKEKMRTPLSYLNLYDQKIYIDQLCYLYWLVEDVVNRVSYIETLYPSLRLMKINEPTYADPQFEAINKTLILWYKIMTELMTKCDTLGRFLGFAKRAENLPYWSWFDQRLDYSRKEYDNVHRWLKTNFKQNSRSQSRSQVSSPVIDLTKPTFPQSSPNPLNNTNRAPRQQTRQISYELHASKKPFTSYDSSCTSIISDFVEKVDSRRGSNNYLSTEGPKKKLPIPNLLTPESLTEFLNKNNNETTHLEPAKIHHVTSYLSQNSLLSNDQDPFSAKFYSTLIQNKTNKSDDSATPGSSTVGFNLNDTALEIDDKPDLDSDLSNESEGVNLISDALEFSDSSIHRQKIFKEFLHKRLRKHGLTKTFDEIRKIVLNTLPQALQTLQIDYCEYYNPTASNNDPSNYHLIPMHKKYLEFMEMFPFDEETLVYGVRSQSFQKLHLPSFRPIFLYLNNIILELMHVCIKMQIDGKRDMKKQSNFKFSLLSIEVLTHELRECIEQAILVRQFYYNMVYSVFDKCEMDTQQQLEYDLAGFDDDLKLIINIYLSFVTDWIHDLVASSDTFKAIIVLQDEWYFCKNNLYFVTASEDIYAKRFCALCITVIASLSDSLHDLDSRHKQPLMEFIANLEINQEMSSLDLGDDDSQLNSLSVDKDDEQPKEILEKSDEDSETRKEEEEESVNNPDDDDEDEYAEDYDNEDEQLNEEEEMVRAHNHYIHLVPGAYDINLKCNEFKEEVNQLRKRCMKALGFCSNLIDDLSLAAKYTVISKIQTLLNELKQTSHVLVVLTNPELQSSQKIVNKSSSEQTLKDSQQQTDTSFMIFVPQEFSKDKIQIARLLFLISAKDDYDNKEAENDDQLNNSASFSDNKNEKLFKSPKFKSSFRRLSSSNSFMETMSEETQKNSILLNKLSRMANLGSAPAESKTKQPKPFNTSYILSPHTNSEGYLLYLKIPSNQNGNFKA